MGCRILIGDVLERLRGLPEESVHCVVTSPPYWGLRDYGVAGQIGLEPTPQEFIEKMTAVFREVRRALRSDGTCWMNMGDCYANDGKWGGSTGGKHVLALHGNSGVGRQKSTTGLKPKDLMGMPWMLAFALRADGWWLRQDIIWSKPNPMPESVRDRCTKAHEYLFLLSKSARYYYDAMAIEEPANPANYRSNPSVREDVPGQTRQGKMDSRRGEVVCNTRNKRSVWSIATEAFSEAHFATFPTKLVEPCILAGTSERGCCASCGAPLVRVTESVDTGRTQKMTDGWAVGDWAHGSILPDELRKGEAGKPVMASCTVGWEPGCKCAPCESVPCTVLDPFSGAGTTGLVAMRCGREYIGIELNPEYAAMAERRICEDAPLFRAGPMTESLEQVG